MSSVHKEYNLHFLNKVSDGMVYKVCELINPNTATYINLSTYLLYLQFSENILDYTIPEIDKMINGDVADDISFEGIDITLGQVNTEISWNGRAEIIPTSDLRLILQEYAGFLQTHPLSGACL